MKIIVPLLVACLLLGFGCAEKPKPTPPSQVAVEPPPAPPPTVFPFTNKTETVASDQIKTAATAQSVSADFNMDGLPDMAVVENPDGQNDQVSVYIQKPCAAGEEKPAKTIYYRGGVIQRVVEGKIAGVMTRQQKDHTDLILLIVHTNGPKEMVHYENDGAQFNIAKIRDKVGGSQTVQDLPQP